MMAILTRSKQVQPSFDVSTELEFVTTGNNNLQEELQQAVE
jgi:hypothetical protein